MPTSTEPPTLTQMWRAEALREQAIQRCEKLASQLTVARVEIRRLSKVSGRNLSRMIAAEHHAEAAEAALALSSSRPARVATLLLRVVRLVHGLRGRCASCGLMDQHRFNCRLDSLVRSIDVELGPVIERVRLRDERIAR